MLKNLLKLGVLAVPLGIMACGQGNERLAEKADIEGRKQAQAAQQVLEEKAQQLEKDLARRHQFYQGVSGTFQGSYAIGGDEFIVRLTTIPSIAPYNSGRIRTLAEIEADLVNLFLNAQVTAWSRNTGASFGCVFSSVRPDFNHGKITLVSDECGNLYSIALGEKGVEDPVVLSEKLLNGDIASVDNLSGTIKSVHNPNVHEVVIRRTSPL